MTIMEMLEQSGVLTLLGMGVVFGFLVIMVITITLAGKLIRALNLNKTTVARAQTASAAAARMGNNVQVTAAASASAGNNAQVAAAISAAVNEYRKQN